ncbi:PREDICTED: formin-like protein 18 [Rhinopithecus bieti]|uniref:formin-like protein 18 n=1 Tax=Rhinopithecus bieti TaxID=61621 RepID=UPI00083BCCBB|nr:PREDICTED: formin-like protein 18 [Rhinopithecus bieti]
MGSAVDIKDSRSQKGLYIQNYYHNEKNRPNSKVQFCRAPAGLGDEVFRAEVPSLQNGRLLPLRTPVPAAKAVAAGAPRGTGQALPLTLSGPADPAAARAPLGAAAQGAQDPPPPPPVPLSGEPGGAVKLPRQRVPRRQRPGPAAPAFLLLPPTANLQSPAEPPLPRHDPIATPGLPLGTGPPGSREEAAAPQGRGGGGGRHHVCPPLPETGCPADKAQRRRGRSGRPGRPRRPPRNKRGQEPRKPGALMQ